MQQNIKVSIICNAYNHEKYVSSALDGFVSQKTDFAFEVLVHDDASTDHTADIIRQYQERYPDLIKPILQTRNQRSQKIRINQTFQLPRAQGKYVAFCEGDDYWTDPLKLQKQYDFLENNPEYSLCACSTDWLNMLTGQIEKKGKIENDRDIPLSEIILEKNGRIFQFATIMMKKEILLDTPSWRYLFPIGDLPTAIQAALNGKVRMLADTMSVYRYYSSGSWTQKMDNDDKRATISRRMIEGFEALNRATDYQYNDCITQRILRHQYTLALMTHDLKALKSDELGPVFRSRNIFLRLSDTARCRFPGAYKSLRNLSKHFFK